MIINMLISTAQKFLLVVVRLKVQGSFRDTFKKLMKAIEVLPRGEKKMCLAFIHTHLYTEYSVVHGHSLPPPPPPPAESIHVSSEGKTCFIWSSFFLTLPFFFFT